MGISRGFCDGLSDYTVIEVFFGVETGSVKVLSGLVMI